MWEIFMFLYFNKKKSNNIVKNKQINNTWVLFWWVA